MSNFSSSGAPSGAEGKVPAFADAVQRAKEVRKHVLFDGILTHFDLFGLCLQIASKIRPGSGPPPSQQPVGQKRPFEGSFEAAFEGTVWSGLSCLFWESWPLNCTCFVYEGENRWGVALWTYPPKGQP